MLIHWTIVTLENAPNQVSMCQYDNITVCPCLIVRLDGCIMIHHHSSKDLKLFRTLERGSPHHHGFPKAHALWPSHMHWWHISLPGWHFHQWNFGKSCRNLAVILHIIYLREGTTRPIQKRVLFPTTLGGAIFCFPRFSAEPKCQAPLPGIQSLMMSCKGSDPGVRLQYVYLDSKEFQLLLRGAAQFSIIYCSWIQSCGIRNSKIHE